MTRLRDTIADDHRGDFHPRAAAELLQSSTHRAHQKLEPYPPWLLASRAVLALVAYGALWVSVRAQHPYGHPTAAVIPVAIAVGVLNAIATVSVAKGQTAGIRGRTRLRPVELAVMGALWVAVFVAIGPLASAGVSDSIVYGLYPATAPLIVVGLAWAVIMGVHADRRACAIGLVAAAIGALALLAGPAGAWAVVGLGVFVLLMARAADTWWRHRARPLPRG